LVFWHRVDTRILLNGAVKEGALADLLLVDGDPIANIKLIEDPPTAPAVHRAPPSEQAGGNAWSRRRSRFPSVQPMDVGDGAAQPFVSSSTI
jgi:hypothetical protein